MTKWVTRIIEDDTLDAMSKSKDDFTSIAHRTGYEYVNIQRYQRGDESYDALGTRIDGITAGVKRDDLLIYQYPTYIGNQFEVSFVEHTVYRGVNLVLLIHDYERLRFGINPGYNEIRVLNLASAIIVPNTKMRDQMREDGVTSKIILQHCWDFLTDRPYANELPAREVVLAGAFAKTNLLSTWNQNIKLIAYGRNDSQQIPAENVDYRGVMPAEELVKQLPNCFGLAWDTGDNYGEYTRYNNPHKVAMYLALGMPVIVWRESAIAKLIQDNHIGFAINSLDEIEILLNAISDDELRALQQRVQNFGCLLRRGYFTERLLVNTEQVVTFENLKLTE